MGAVDGVRGVTTVVGQTVTVRVAASNEGALVHDLQANGGGGAAITGLDWSDIGSNWLVAESDGYPVGAVCLLFGKPMSFVHELYIDRHEPPRVQALAVKALLTAALQACRLEGVQMLYGVVPHELVTYRRVLERRRAVKWYDGSTYVIRV